MSNKNPVKIIEDVVKATVTDPVKNTATSVVDAVSNPAKTAGSLAKLAVAAPIGLATGDFSLGTEPGDKLSGAGRNVAGSANKAALEAGIAGGGNAPSNAATTPTPVPTMPTVDSEAVRQARRRQATALRNRGGRSSTILTGGSSTLGG